PDHIDIIPAKEPLEAGGVVEALLLHDIVPGGTGYLADLRDPDTMWKVLYEAWRHLAECECKEANQWACAKCLLPYVPRSTASTVSRSIAEQKLAELLVAGRSGVALSGNAKADADHRWKVSAEVPQTMDPESYLERRFRQVFRDRMERANIAVQDKPAPTGTELSIHRTGSRIAWRLTPQVPLERTKPDFLLQCEAVNIPDIAIYTAGRAFHASSAVKGTSSSPSPMRMSNLRRSKRTGRKRLGAQVCPTGSHDKSSRLCSIARNSDGRPNLRKHLETRSMCSSV